MTASVTIVVPCYNEAERLDVRAFRDFARRHERISFLFVDDGSEDATRAVIERLCGTGAGRFDLHVLAENRGKAEAVRQGIVLAIDRGARVVGYWDADLATPLDEIPRLLDCLERDPDRRVVLGTRIALLGHSIQRRFVRRALGRMFARVASAVLRLPVYDTQCGAKLFLVTPELRDAFARPFCSRWIFDVELLARLMLLWPRGREAARQGAVCEMPLDRWTDVAGSKLRATDFLRAIGELAGIYGRYVRRRAAARYRHCPSGRPPEETRPADDRRRAA